jgi:hypothetical protein
MGDVIHWPTKPNATIPDYTDQEMSPRVAEFFRRMMYIESAELLYQEVADEIANNNR